MPRIKNWERIHDGTGKITWRHRIEPDVYVIAEDKTEHKSSSKASHWTVHLYDGSDPVHQITGFEEQKNQARTEAADWMRDNPQVDDDLLQDEAEEATREEEIAKMREKAREHGLIPRELEDPYWELKRRALPALDSVRPRTVTPDDGLARKGLALYLKEDEDPAEIESICQEHGLQEVSREPYKDGERVDMALM